MVIWAPRRRRHRSGVGLRFAMDSWLDNSGLLRRPEADIESITTDSCYKKRNPRWSRQNSLRPTPNARPRSTETLEDRDAP